MLSNFKFFLVKRFLGYNSARDGTNLDPRYLIRGSKNVYRKESGTIASRPGLKRRGSADTTAEGVISSFDWEASNGVFKEVRIANSKLEVESDIVESGTYVWYTLQDSLTNTRYVFDTVWDDTNKKDFLVFVRGDSNLFRWDGGIGLISSTTSNTIVFASNVLDLGFNPTSGSVVINGATYTYSGSSSATLTGVSPNPTGEADGSVVISAVVTNANTPASGFNGDFVKTIRNQLYVGSYNSRLGYISKKDDYTDYTQGTPRSPGDGEVITMDDNCRGIGVIGGEAYFAAGFSDWYRVRFNQITVGSTLTEQALVDKLELSGLEAALGHEYISNTGGFISYLSRDKQVKLLGTFTNEQQTKPATLSLPIKDELRNQTFNPVQGSTSGGELRNVGGRLYLTTVSGGTTYVHETREVLDERGQVVAERLWQPPQIWGISRIALIDGIEYGHSIANPQIYQLWDTDQWSDDSPDDEQLPYDCVMRMSYRNHQSRVALKNFDMIFYEGYMPQGTQLKGRAYIDYQGSNTLHEFDINKTTITQKLVTFFSSFLTPGLGDSSLGDNPIGQGLTDSETSQIQLPKFRKIVDVAKVDNFEYSLEVYTEDLDSRWEILAIGTNTKKSELSPTFLRG